MKKKLMAGTVIVAILAVALLVFGGSSDEEVVSYSLDDIAGHASADDCWMIIDGGVYDVTMYIAAEKHGPAIAQGCGKDATEGFETRPMGSGTPHSANARVMMKEYYIGDLE